jgi:MFS family permease
LTKTLPARISNPALLMLVFCDGATLAASMMGRIAVPWWIVEAGGAAHLGLFFAALAVCSIVILFILSPVADTLRRDLALRMGLALGTVGPLALLLVALAGKYELSLLITFEVISVIASALILPASAALIGDLLAPGDLARGFAFQKTAQSIGRLLGPLVGGALVGTGGVAWALAIQALLLFLSFLISCALPKQKRPESKAARPWIEQLRDGFLVKWRIPIERQWTCSSLLMMMLINPSIGLLVVLKIKALGLSPGWFGAVEAGLSIGMLLSSVWLVSMLTKKFGRYATNAGALLTLGPTVLLIALLEHPVLLVLLMMILGSAIAAIQLVGQTHRVLAVPASFRARFAAVNFMTLHLAGTAGPLLAAAFVEFGGTSQTHLAFGFGVLAVGISYLFIPGLRDFLLLTHDEVLDWYRRTYPAAFPSEPQDLGSSR